MYDDYKIELLHIILPKMIAYVKSYDGQTKWMYFLIEEDDFLAKYNAIWDKVSTNMKQEFNSDPVYNKTFVKTKTKSMCAAATAFHDKKIPKMDSNCTYVAVISLYSVFKKDENYYPQEFLKECKCISKLKEMLSILPRT